MATIRAAAQDDRQAWEKLWSENCAHFGAKGMTEAVIKGLWQRIIEPSSQTRAWLAFNAEEPVGLAHTILHPHTFSLRSVCYLEDLWVSPLSRGQGVATMLIQHLETVGVREGWRRLYWETDIENKSAQRLYDRIAARRPTTTYQIEIAG